MSTSGTTKASENLKFERVYETEYTKSLFFLKKFFFMGHTHGHGSTFCDGAYDAPAFPMEPDHVHFRKVRNRF